MIHLPQLIQDLGIILVTAAVVTIIFKILKQPVVLGYLIAGFLLGPQITFLPTIQDTSAIKIWAEIGVIFLLFALGLEFSFKKLAKVGKSATITAVFETSFMMILGYVAGRLLNWKPMDCIFLGGILSISSTSIIVRAVDEMGLKARKFVSLVFGILIVEDIVAVLLMVLLSTVAISQAFSGSELLLSVARLGFFLVLWFVLGIYLLPILISKVRYHLNNETTLVVSLGLCLFMVMVAAQVGFSPALGAFMMGSILSETKEGERIEKLIHPVRDLFVAIFFVTVGMLIDPTVLVDYRYEILFITLILITGKLLGASLGALISGAGVRKSVQVGMSLTQIGEFSFIIATLGLTLNVTSSFLYPIAVAVSAITTFSTPYLIKWATPLGEKIESNIPPRLYKLIEKYQIAVQSEGGASGGIAQLVWLVYGWRIILNTTVVVAIFLFAEKLGLSFVVNIFGKGFLSSLVLTVGALVVAAPFLWAISFGESQSFELQKVDRARLQKLNFGIQLARGFFALNLAAFFINGFLSINSLAGIIIFLLLALILAASRFSNVYSKIENTFIENLGGNKNTVKPLPSLTPWDVAMVEFVVNPNSSLIGTSLLNAKLRESFGVTVALVQRGDINFVAPDRNWVIMPYDKLFIIGSDEQLEKVKLAFEEINTDLCSQTNTDFFGLKSILLESDSPFVDKIIRDSGIRDIISGMIVGIERDGQRILSPDSSLSLKSGDLLWVVGDIEKIKALKS